MLKSCSTQLANLLAAGHEDDAFALEVGLDEAPQHVQFLWKLGKCDTWSEEGKVV